MAWTRHGYQIPGTRNDPWRDWQKLGLPFVKCRATNGGELCKQCQEDVKIALRRQDEDGCDHGHRIGSRVAQGRDRLEFYCTDCGKIAIVAGFLSVKET